MPRDSQLVEMLSQWPNRSYSTWDSAPLLYRRLLQVFSHTARVRPSEDNSYGSIGLAVKSGKSAAPTAKMHPRRRCRLMAVTLRWTERWMGTGIFGCSKDRKSTRLNSSHRCISLVT